MQMRCRAVGSSSRLVVLSVSLGFFDGISLAKAQRRRGIASDIAGLFWTGLTGVNRISFVEAALQYGVRRLAAAFSTGACPRWRRRGKPLRLKAVASHRTPYCNGQQFPLRLCENIPFGAGLSRTRRQDDRTTQSCKCVVVPSGRLVVRSLPLSIAPQRTPTWTLAIPCWILVIHFWFIPLCCRLCGMCLHTKHHRR